MPVNVIAGCIAATRAPTARAGSRTASPCRPEVCTTCWPSWSAPLSASILTTLASMSSGTASSSRSQSRATAVGLRRGTPGSSSAIRRCEASDSPAAADHLVAGGAERGAQDGADAARADDTHAHAMRDI